MKMETGCVLMKLEITNDLHQQTIHASVANARPSQMAMTTTARVDGGLTDASAMNGYARILFFFDCKTLLFHFSSFTPPLQSPLSC